MEGLASNFETVLPHFAQSLQGAFCVAVDMELTGIRIENRPDRYDEYAEERMDKYCSVAEKHIPIQIGFTVVNFENDSYTCDSYNFYAFPWKGPECSEPDQSFLCQLSAMKFNADRSVVDFNKWLRDGVPYMTREDESSYLARLDSHTDMDLPRKTGLLRLWKLLCDSKVPVITHGPLDIFFLLTCFERRELPRDPRKLSQLISECLPFVFDTAHLHSVVGGFKKLELTKFLEEAEARYQEHALAEHTQCCRFRLQGETERQYGRGRHRAHEAGFDSLCAAQLFTYLINLSQAKVCNAVNRLFLHNSTECLNLTQARETGDIASSIFRQSDEVPVVVQMDYCKKSIRKQISAVSASSRWMQDSHVLFILSGPDSDWAFKLGMPSFEQWRSLARSPSLVNEGQEKNKIPSQSCFRISAREWLGDDCTATSAREWLGDDCTSASARKWLGDACTATSARTCLGDEAVKLQFRGVIKAFDPSKGYGFIACAETYVRYKRDVFIHHSQIDGLEIGQIVSFAVSTNSRGQPQAKDVLTLDYSTEIMDKDEIETTTGGRSNTDSDDIGEIESCRFSHSDSDVNDSSSLSEFQV